MFSENRFAFIGRLYQNYSWTFYDQKESRDKKVEFFPFFPTAHLILKITHFLEPFQIGCVYVIEECFQGPMNFLYL